MKRQAFIAILLLFMSIVYSARGVSHQLIDEHYLDVGNEWFYDVTITIQDNASVNIQAASFNEITGTKTVGTYNAAIVSSDDPSSSILDYLFMTPDYVLEVGYDYSEPGISMHGIYRNGNPLETLPVWVDESHNNYVFGSGDFDLTLDDPPISWTESFDTKITYQGTETVTVPAGTFDCINVLIRSDWTDSLGPYGHTIKTASICPDVGIVKLEDYIWVWDSIAEASIVNEYSAELVYAEVSFQPSIAKDTTIIDFDDVSNSETFQVWNDGGRTLNYDVSISQGSAYFSVLPATASSSDSSDKITHTVTLNRASIPPGQQVFGRIEISANGADNGPQYIDLLAGTTAYDMNPVGTWQGTDEDGASLNFVLHNNGTVTGTWEADMGYCTIYFDLSGNYNVDPADGHLTAHPVNA